MSSIMLVDVVRQIRVTVPNLEKRIKELRESSGKSAQFLATEAGISTAYWYQIEKGERQYITEEVLRGIERALGTDFGVNFNFMIERLKDEEGKE